jgi:hypothetical protein
LVDFQTPSPAAAIETILAFIESRAMPVMRPLKGPPTATGPLELAAGPIAVNGGGDYHVTVLPAEKREVSPKLSVRVAVMRGFVASDEVFVVVKVKFCVPVVVGVTVIESRKILPSGSPLTLAKNSNT